MLKQLSSLGGCFLTGALVALYFSHGYYTDKIDAIYRELELKSQDVQIQALTRKADAENALSEHQLHEEASAFDAYADISKKYDLVSGLGVLTADRVRYQDGDTDSAPALPDTSAVTCKTAEDSDCRRVRQAYARLKKLCTTLARERDEIAVDRNELIKLYNQVRANGLNSKD